MCSRNIARLVTEPVYRASSICRHTTIRFIAFLSLLLPVVSLQVEVINSLTLLTAKPITYLVNLSERDFVRKKNKWLARIKAWIDENNPGDALIPFSVALEERLVKMGEEEKVEESEKLGLPKGNPSALGKITTAGYASLELIRYFTCRWLFLILCPRYESSSWRVGGPDEVRAWTVRKGIKAPQAAGVIQCVAISPLVMTGNESLTLASSDFENKFVCGEIMAYDDLKEYGTEAQVKAAGKLRQQGKPYEVVDGDICYWKSGA
jgi:obg-like ATPase 1